MSSQKHDFPIPKSDEYSQRLLEITYHSVTTRGTRGSVLIDLGRVEEGKAMLTQVLAETKSDMDREFCLVFLSIAEEQLGNFESADLFAKQALSPIQNTTAQSRITEQTKARLIKSFHPTW